MKLTAGKVVVFSVVSLILVGSFGFIQWMRQPAHGSITKEDHATEVMGLSKEQEEFSTRLFTTRIDSSLKVKNKNEVPSSAILGQYLLTNKDAYESDQLAITVGVAKENDVLEISPVQFRRTQPNEYSEDPGSSDYPPGSIVFTKKTGYERSVFWTSDGKYVGVVVSGGIQKKADLEESLRILLANWQWK